MKKREFTKYLLTSAAMMMTMICQSCQPKPMPPTPRCPSSDCDSDSRKTNRERNYQEEEQNEETMMHVIEIDQPVSNGVTFRSVSKLRVYRSIDSDGNVKEYGTAGVVGNDWRFTIDGTLYYATPEQ